MTLRDDWHLCILQYSLLVTKVAVTPPKHCETLSKSFYVLICIKFTWFNYWDNSSDAKKKKLQVLKMPWWHIRIKNPNKPDSLSLPKEKECRWPSVCSTSFKRLCHILIFVLVFFSSGKVHKSSLRPFLPSLTVTF